MPTAIDLIKWPVRTVRGHARTIARDIIREPLNYGHRRHMLARYARWHLLHKYLGRDWTFELENGMRSKVSPFPDHDAGEVNIWTRNVDWHDTQFVRGQLRPGDFIVDAGCNVGNRTLALADMIDGALLIDAGKRATERTREHLQLNGLPHDRFIVLRAAVGDRIGTVTFTDLGGASTVNKVVSSSAAVSARTVEVPMTTIDVELEKLGRTAAYIKIDVEGQDLAALRGSVNALRSGNTRLVKFERNQSEPLEPCLEFFDSLGWRVFALDRTGKPTSDSAVVARNMNLLAMPAAAAATVLGG